MATITMNHPVPRGGLLAGIRQDLAAWRDYRRTLAALHAMDVRQRDDIGVAGADLGAIARKAVPGRH